MGGETANVASRLEGRLTGSSFGELTPKQIDGTESTHREWARAVANLILNVAGHWLVDFITL